MHIGVAPFFLPVYCRRIMARVFILFVNIKVGIAEQNVGDLERLAVQERRPYRVIVYRINTIDFLYYAKNGNREWLIFDRLNFHIQFLLVHF
jgi:hypothetical protein